MNPLRSTFLALSSQPSLRSLAQHSALGRRLSHRFVAGTRIEDAIAVTRRLNAQGIAVTLDALGENVTELAQAQRAARTYHALLDAIASGQLDANVSLKLTQMGMDLPGNPAESLVAELARHATSIASFVRVDMEGSAYTSATIGLVRRLRREPAQQNIGIVLQSYLRRTEADLHTLLRDGIRIRLCKGAYQEPPALAFPGKAEVDANYLRLMRLLLASGLNHALATHDAAIISQAQTFARENSIPQQSFEFQMLYGIRRDLQLSLVSQGYRVRVYVPFGLDWYPYFMRRLAERPANAFFLAKNLFR
jgi:proline dehydrogenase